MRALDEGARVAHIKRAPKKRKFQIGIEWNTFIHRNQDEMGGRCCVAGKIPANLHNLHRHQEAKWPMRAAANQRGLSSQIKFD